MSVRVGDVRENFTLLRGDTLDRCDQIRDQVSPTLNDRIHLGPSAFDAFLLGHHHIASADEHAPEGDHDQEQQQHQHTEND